MDASLLNKWTQENNSLVKAWKLSDGRISGIQNVVKFHSESRKLLQTIQGVPAVRELLELEFTVAYNALVFSLKLSDFGGAQEILTHTLSRGLEADGCEKSSIEDPATLWLCALKSPRSSLYHSCLHHLLCVQWGVWLASGQIENFQHLLREVTQEDANASSPMDLGAMMKTLQLSGKENYKLQIVVTAREFKDLLHLCTVLTEGLSLVKQEHYSAALTSFLHALNLPAPRLLLAQIYTVTGFVYAKLNQPQSSLQSYRRALEMDYGCHGALYQSALVYRHLKNSRAEIEALRLLHAGLVQQVEKSTNTASMIISPNVLLSGQNMDNILAVPSPRTILHSLACTCLQADRISEAVDHYLDLISSLQSDVGQPVSQSVYPEGESCFSRVPVVYLEAAFTLLAAKRAWDAITVCEEVVTKTASLLPQRLKFNQPEENLLFAMEGSTQTTKREQLNCMLWTSAAYYLQGLAYCCIKETKQSVENFTRSINWLARVSFDKPDGDTGAKDDHELEVKTVHRQRWLALAGRGLSFLERGQLKEALRDLKLSQQHITDIPNIKSALVNVYQRLGREEEAIFFWKKSQDACDCVVSGGLPLYLHRFPEVGLSFQTRDLGRTT